MDAAIGALATRQHGVVARAQVVELGLGRHGIRHRVLTGRLFELHRGVYAVGHGTVSREGRWMAAVLACGAGAVLSHRSAAELWGLRATRRTRVEVTVARALRARPGLQIHRRGVAEDEATEQDGIPVTTVPRTLVDLATVMRPADVRRAAEQAETLRLTDPLSLDAVVRRHSGRPGIRRVAEIADEGIAPTITRSELERRFLTVLEEHGIPAPEMNAALRIGDRWIEADCVWRGPRLIVELDGHAFHSTRAAFERDRERDRLLQAAGWRVIRLTWRQLRDDAATVAADLAKLLA